MNNFVYYFNISHIIMFTNKQEVEFKVKHKVEEEHTFEEEHTVEVEDTVEVELIEYYDIVDVARPLLEAKLRRGQPPIITNRFIFH